MRRLAADPECVDWFAVLIDLQRQGIPTSSVASLLAIPKSTILGWKQGAEPRHRDGERLIDLWVGVTGNAQAKLPRMRSANSRESVQA